MLTNLFYIPVLLGLKNNFKIKKKICDSSNILNRSLFHDPKIISWNHVNSRKSQKEKIENKTQKYNLKKFCS